MAIWTTYKLEEVCSKIGSGATPKGGKSAYISEGISLIRSQNVLDFTFTEDGLAFINETQAKALANVEVHERDVLVNITGDSVARVCQVPDKYLPARVNQHVAILRADTTKLSPEFLKYSLLTKYNKDRLLSLASTGATRNALTKGMLEDFEISTPENVVVQNRIAEILSALDDKIELNRRMNQTLEQMAQTLFRQYFVDGIDEDNLPEGWLIVKVQDVFNITIGRTPPRAQREWFTTDPADVKWMSIKDLGNCGVYISDTSEYLTEAAVKKFNVPVIPDNTVVLSFKLTVGRVAITTDRMLSNEAIAHFIPKADTYLSTEFVYQYLKEFNYDSLGNTSSIATAVNSKTIKEMPMLLPDHELMAMYTNNVKNLFAKVKANSTEINTLTQLRDTLLPKLMSGEIDVMQIKPEELHEPVLS